MADVTQLGTYAVTGAAQPLIAAQGGLYSLVTIKHELSPVAAQLGAYSMVTPIDGHMPTSLGVYVVEYVPATIPPAPRRRPLIMP